MIERSRDERRRKERKPGHVIVVEVAEQDVEAGDPFLAQRDAGVRDARARIENEHAAVDADLEARRVPAITDCFRARTRKRPPRAPEPNREAFRCHCRDSTCIETGMQTPVTQHV